MATTILGFVLQNNEDLQQRIVNGALDQIPVLGEQLANDPTSLNGSVWVLIAGLLTALWSATKAFVGLQVALDDIWEIPINEREAMPVQRFRAVLGLVIIGVSQIGSLAVSAIVNAAELPNLSRILLLLAGLVVNIAVLAFMYRLLTAASPTWRDVWPGAIAAGIAFSLLQYFGSGIVNRITENASDTYGQFALVLALVTWLGFLAISALMAGELNARARPPPHRSGDATLTLNRPKTRLRRDFGDPPLRNPDANGELSTHTGEMPLPGQASHGVSCGE